MPSKLCSITTREHARKLCFTVFCLPGIQYQKDWKKGHFLLLCLTGMIPLIQNVGINMSFFINTKYMFMVSLRKKHFLQIK